MEPPTIFWAKGFPRVFESRKHSDAPRTVVAHDRRLPHIGPNTRALVIVTTFAGSGAMMACATINSAEITIAHDPKLSSVARRFSTLPVFGPMTSSTRSEEHTSELQSPC